MAGRSDPPHDLFDSRPPPHPPSSLQLSMSPAPLLALRQLVKNYGGVRALRGVDFDLQAGEVHALLGENGAGKSTLIKVITGAHQPNGGTLTLAGQRVANLTPSSARALGIACIYQQPALFPDLTVAENLALRLEATSASSRIDWPARRARAEQWLARLGAEISPEAEVRSLSMPEQQLVEIACALGAGARIVIMDEPTASLTQKEQRLLFAVVRDLRKNGVGVIYISHRLEEIFALADRVTVLRDGQSVGTHAVGDIDEAGLIRLMVGREVAQIYPAAESAPGRAVALSLQAVGCRASGVHNVSFEVRSGEIFGLGGLVGAGRTELARILFGLTPADSGEITLHGQRLTLRSPQAAVAHGIAYVPEDRRRHGIVGDLPVRANTTLAILPQLSSRALLDQESERELATEWVTRLGIKTDGIDAPASSLSGGNQQKVAISRWLATEPKVLILDEPTQGIDVGAKAECHRIMCDMAAKGLAIVMISSELNEILGMCDRVAVMRNGHIVATVARAEATAESLLALALGHTS